MKHPKDTNLNLALLISNKIADLYAFHDYEVKKDRIVELTKLILLAEPELTEKEAENFFLKIKMGEFGVVYKAPSCLMSMFQTYRGYIVRQRILGNIE